MDVRFDFNVDDEPVDRPAYKSTYATHCSISDYLTLYNRLEGTCSEYQKRDLACYDVAFLVGIILFFVSTVTMITGAILLESSDDSWFRDPIYLLFLGGALSLVFAIGLLIFSTLSSKKYTKEAKDAIKQEVDYFAARHPNISVGYHVTFRKGCYGNHIKSFHVTLTAG